MFAPQNQQPTVIDAMTGTLQDWYDAVDVALKTSEIIPGNYEYSTAISYGSVGDISEGDNTTFDIATDRFRIISLDNSYITLEQDVTINVPDLSKSVFKKWYIGYKFSGDIIDQYRMFSNTDKVQDVHNAHYEWFMLYNSLSDEAKNNSDCYATIDKIRNMNPLVPGVYCDFSSYTGAVNNVHVKIPLRIPIASFLMLYNLRYFPNWAGKLSVDIYPTYQNLVIAPVVNMNDFTTAYTTTATVNNVAVTTDHSIKEAIEALLSGDYGIDLGFRNIGESNVNNSISNVDGSALSCRFTGVTQTTKSCGIKLATYLLKMNVFNALAAKYISVPMMFPIQQVVYKPFTNAMTRTVTVDGSLKASTDDNTIDTAATIGLRHADSMFIVFRQSDYSRTCFINPEIKYSVNLDGKYYPRESYTTVDDSKHINMLFDSLNINNSLLTSISNDLMTSQQPYKIVRTFAAGATTATETKVFNGKDNSNFMIGIPFADNEDFMGGITTTGCVQIQLTGERIGTDNLKNIIFTTPVAIFFEDAILKIRAVKPDAGKQIDITQASIEQIYANGT